MSIYSKSKVRDSEAAQILQEFIDDFEQDDFAKGFEYLMDRLDDITSDIDKVASELEQLCSSYESDIEVYQSELADLNEQLEDKQ